MTTYGVSLQLKRIWPIAILGFLALSPSELGGLKFLPIYEALTIRAQKTAPPYIAFDEVNNFAQTSAQQDEWSQLEASASIPLLADGKTKNFSVRKIQTQKIVLNEMVIQKKPEIVYADVAQGLSPQQKRRLEEAQAKSDVLEQDWNLPTWSDEAQKVLAEAGYTEKNNRLIPPRSTHPEPQRIFVAATDANGQQKTEISHSEVYTVADNDISRTSGRKISGPLEITGGLAVTNEHYIEVRRTNEGVAREIGRVDLQKGTYNINVDETSGSIEARLVDKAGKILGEGSVRLARMDLNQLNVLGPKLKIEPHANFAGLVSNFYQNKADNSTPPKTIATLMKGAEELSVGKDGHIAMEKMARGSSTVMRAAAPHFMQTAAVVFSGEEFSAPLFPVSMIQALREIVTNQRQALSSDDSLGAVVWGKVTQDGKPVSGIQVQMEGDEEGVQAIYFNQFMLPDPKLTATSKNGLYAFIDVEEGFQSLLATRGESIFGYQNVVAENGSVALGDIENTIKIESVPLRVFDAFNGSPQPARVTLQSIDHELDVAEGTSVLLLPQVNRMGLIRVTPESNDYLPARYFYNDKDTYIHLPLVSWSWLANIKSYLKISDQTDSAIIVGFTPGEDFEVYLAGYDNFDRHNVVYFDMQGRILQINHGIAGGGFILYNVPADTHEVVVVGAKSEKIYSKVLPVDPNSLSVLSFHE